MKADKASREKAARSLHEAIRKLRDQNPPSSLSSPEAALEALKVEMERENRLWTKLPRVLQEHASEINDETAQLQRSNAELERILEGYQKNYHNVLQYDDNATRE